MAKYLKNVSLAEQVKIEAKYIIKTKKTIREAAKDLGVSKSVLHRHLSQVLKRINIDDYLKIKKIFLEHNKIRHIMGGLATKKKYKDL